MASNNNVPELLSYPATLGKDVAQGQHYMLIDSYESKNAADFEGSGTRKSSIALYIPPNALSTTIAQSYEGLKGGRTLIAGAQLSGAGDGDQNVELGSFVKQGLQGLLSKPQAVADFQSATRGLARNNHMALIYRGPGEFRTHTFNFSFWPKTRKEADSVRKIIQDFKLGSTPRLSGFTDSATDITKLRSPYFAAPRHWQIKFCLGKLAAAGENPYLFKIGRSVITTMTINHDPDSVVGFHKDGSPVHSTVSVTFQEIEYVLNTVDTISAVHQKQIDAAETSANRVTTAGSSDPDNSTVQTPMSYLDPSK